MLYPDENHSEPRPDLREQSSRFRLFQPVVATRVTRMDFSKGEAQHGDPFETRVVGWDTLGRIEVAVVITSNPHMASWCWTEDLLEPSSAHDWYTDEFSMERMHRVGDRVNFLWEMSRWDNLFPSWERGETVPAVILAPHIAYGDWLVAFQKKSGDWIRRVVNERQIWDR